MSYKFFQNKDCEWLPCHKTKNIEDFNCLMCFCPLYYIKDCGGSFIILDNVIKDCSNCLLPHYDYDYVINKIKDYNKEIT